MTTATITRQAEIETMAARVEIQYDNRGAYAQLPSSRHAHISYRIDIDMSGNPVASRCQCPATVECKHMKAVNLHCSRLVAKKVRKRKSKELAPELAALQLPAGQKAHKVRGKSQLVVAVKVAKQEQAPVAPVVEPVVIEQTAEAHHIIDEQEVIPATPQAPQWSNRPLTMDERIAASRKESEKRSQAPLNGNRGFRFMR